MNQLSTCSKCEATVPAETTDGLCPACLLREAIEIGKLESGLAETINPDSAQPTQTGVPTSEEFGDYESLEEIARGGMGVVYKAIHRRLNRPVALKMILAGQLASEQDIQRFQREAEAAANLDHPGIVPIYEIGEHGSQHFFSMKLVEGGSLASRMPELRKDLRGFVRLIERVSRAVHYAHQRGILHRDLKPANILLDEDDQPLVTDLGLARQIESGGSDITRTGAVVGTPAYMPPEQAAAKKEVTTAVDIYAIGAMLYEALVGRPPHVGDSPVETLMHVMKNEVVPPHEINRRVDRLLERICMKCLEKNPNDRYASAAALADDLDNWLHGRAISVRRPSLASTVTELFRMNLRSAVGATVVGIIGGVLLSFCISRCNSKGYLRENTPTSIYEKLPAEIPFGRSMVFLQETKQQSSFTPYAFLVWNLTTISVGGIVALVVRPKPGTEAVAVGLVAGLFMAITAFTLHLGFGAVADGFSRSLPTVAALTDAALGTNEQQQIARDHLYEAYPGLKAIPESERSRFLPFRVLYDSMFHIPVGMFWGMTMSTLLSLIPCLIGTAFASKLQHESSRTWKRTAVYVELMIIMQLLLIVPFMMIVQSDEGRFWVGVSVRGWIEFAAFYLFFTAMAVITFRRSFRWYWRIALIASFTAAMLIVLKLLA